MEGDRLLAGSGQQTMQAPLVIVCYQCKNQMGVPPGAMQAGCPTCNAVNNVQPQGMPMATPMASPVVMVAPPVHQMMTDVLGILGPQKGILMRQKVDLLEALSGWEMRNKYTVSIKPHDKGDAPQEWEDETFKKALKHGHILSMKEESDCCQRQCCRPRHSFTIKVKGGNDTKMDGETLAEFDRPFKCTCICCCTLFNPQVLTAALKGGKVTGRVIQHWPLINNLMLCTRYWRVVDGEGKDKYMIYDNFCCNENMFAPSCFCPVHTIDIMTPDQSKKLGSIVNIWPGCNFRSLCAPAVDNYILNFPADASPEDKLNLLGALVLVEYMVFEKKPRNDNNAALALDL
jgi:hypothetical protein